MKYLNVNVNGFGFKTDEIHEITESDKQISDEIYNEFFSLQSQGKQFKVKNINGTTFEEIFEEVIPEPIQQPTQPPSNADLQKQIFDLTTQLVAGGVL